MALEDALTQVLRLDARRLRRCAGERRRAGLRHLRSRRLGRGRRRRRHQRGLLQMIQHDGVPGGGIRNHRCGAGIDARLSITRAGEPMRRLYRRKAGAWRLNRTCVFGGGGRHGGRHSTHTLSRAAAGSIAVSSHAVTRWRHRLRHPPMPVRWGRNRPDLSCPR